jgi:molybdopterin molybdotransferase
LLTELSAQYPCLSACVIHRVGVVPVGEAAIYVGIASAHRAEGFALLAAFMDRLKQDVPIWKRRALPLDLVGDDVRRLTPSSQKPEAPHVVPCRSVDEALADIRLRCAPLPPTRTPLAEAFGLVLRETVCAPDDLPAFDRSAVDGFAVRCDDSATEFRVVDSLRAGDWKPRALQPGEAVRIATGAALPGDGLQVVMQEDTQREGDLLRVLRRDTNLHVRFRGEDLRAGQALVHDGARLDAGALALLATVGHVAPLVSPRLRVLHLTTGDEIVPPNQVPRPGQVRDSNSILIRSLLRDWPCDVTHRHLPEDFETAWRVLDEGRAANADLLLVSGGASVGERDFTRALLERLGFEIVFGRIKARPGKPTIFGVNGHRVAFGLPGNPLAHFVCFHLDVATALGRLLGAAELPQFLPGKLAVELRDKPCPRETLWPARLEWTGFAPVLRPLRWRSSGDITCLAEANALIRVPAGCGVLGAEEEVEFLPTMRLTAGRTTRPDET